MFAGTQTAFAVGARGAAALLRHRPQGSDREVSTSAAGAVPDARRIPINPNLSQ
eukprot:SAG31_NODE_9267_length_1306_cov_2.754764_2_plen_54_part_00